MSNLPTDLKYSKTHEWARDEGDGTITVGITDHAQEQLGDLVFVDLPEEGDSVDAGADCAVVESVKAASDIYSPVSGEIVAVNAALADSPEMVNESAFGDGWLFKLKMSDASQLESLLDADGYAEVAAAEEH
jgi:glycine cleavage system H protein